MLNASLNYRISYSWSQCCMCHRSLNTVSERFLGASKVVSEAFKGVLCGFKRISGGFRWGFVDSGVSGGFKEILGAFKEVSRRFRVSSDIKEISPGRPLKFPGMPLNPPRTSLKPWPHRTLLKPPGSPTKPLRNPLMATLEIPWNLWNFPRKFQERSWNLLKRSGNVSKSPDFPRNALKPPEIPWMKSSGMFLKPNWKPLERLWDFAYRRYAVFQIFRIGHALPKILKDQIHLLKSITVKKHSFSNHNSRFYT